MYAQQSSKSSKKLFPTIPGTCFRQFFVKELLQNSSTVHGIRYLKVLEDYRLLSRKMKCIFLDIDGVLAPFDGVGKISREHLSRLVDVIKQTNARIVVSSDWRQSSEGLNSIKTELSKVGILESFLGVTPTLGYDPSLHYLQNSPENIRSREILLWIKEFTEQSQIQSQAQSQQQTKTLSKTQEKYTKDAKTSYVTIHVANHMLQWVAVDDMDMSKSPGMEGHFVLTDSHAGIQEDHVVTLIRILNSG